MTEPNFAPRLNHVAISLVAQADTDWTAIVIDDASPENGARALVEALGDSRVTYTRNETNLGLAANFNRCLELGRQVGDVVTIFHADDIMEPGYVGAIRAAHLVLPTAACVAPRVTVIDLHARTTQGPTHDYTLTSAYVGFVIPLLVELQHLERRERATDG